MANDWVKKYISLGNLILVFGLIQFLWLVWYFYTGFGRRSWSRM
jgi:hypothetical protein